MLVSDSQIKCYFIQVGIRYDAGSLNLIDYTFIFANERASHCDPKTYV